MNHQVYGQKALDYQINLYLDEYTHYLIIQ